ncbi:Lysosomal acid glucosylceramidase [Halotydeus destructor]|nr:Lysosomal acid glucosylceramidase [Halotydeus destructor]
MVSHDRSSDSQSHSLKPYLALPETTDSIVCVCNLSYCDQLGKLGPRNGQLATVVESNKAGLRFEPSIQAVSRRTDDVTSARARRPSSNSVVAKITIDRNVKYQERLGFGGAFTDSAVLNINNLTKSLANKVLESYFLDTGLEYRFGRVPIGGTAFSTRPYTLDDVKDGGSDFQLARFSLAEEDVKYRLPLLRSTLAMSSHEIELFATAWTAPAWMKTSNKLMGKDGQLKGKPGGEYYKTWANYYVKFLKAYEANGVALWGLTTGNEPSTPFYSEYALINDMGFTPDTLRDFLKLDLGPTLKEAGFGVDKLKILAPDADFILLFDNYVDAILQDAEAAKYVYGI